MKGGPIPKGCARPASIQGEHQRLARLKTEEARADRDGSAYATSPETKARRILSRRLRFIERARIVGVSAATVLWAAGLWYVF